MDTIIRVIEENVDGCGSAAEIFVKFNAVTQEIVEQFQEKLREVKRMHAWNDFSTEDYVNEALSQFTSPSVHGEIIPDPFGWEVTF